MAARPGARGLNEFTLVGVMADVGTAGVGLRFPIPEDCVLVKVAAVRHGALTAAAAVLTVAGPDGNVATTLTMPSAGAANDVNVVDVTERAANNRFEADKFATVSSDGGPTNAVAATVLLTFRR